jgi:hypothetical protein
MMATQAQKPYGAGYNVSVTLLKLLMPLPKLMLLN